MPTVRFLALASFVGFVLGSGCVTDHNALKKRPDLGTGGSAGRGASGGSLATGGGSGSGGSAGRDDEPPGENVLTVLHGVVDAQRIVFCFARFDAASGSATHVSSPIPEQTLGFGERLSLRTLPELDFANDSLQPFVIAGDLELIEGLDCAEAVALAEAEELEPQAFNAGGAGGEGAGGEGGSLGDAGAAGQGGAPPDDPPVPPKLRVRGLPVVPKGTLSGGRSYLLVAAGCLGGPAFTDPIEAEICGAGYTPESPTVTALLVALSRQIEFAELGLQVVHASLATPEIDVRAAPPADTADVPIAIASNVTLGAVAPRPPKFGHSRIALGTHLPTWTVELMMEGASKPEFWPTIIARGGNTELADSHTYALVVVGPRADIGGFSWWNQAVITAIPSDPPQ